jgi:phage gp36-like protein
MAYSSQTDVQNALGGAKRLVEAFDWDRDTVADAAVIADCIAEADALIDSFASKRYTVPFSPVPETIRRTSAKLAILIGARRRGMMTDAQQTEWDQLAGTERGKEGWLYQLARGVVTPGGDPLPAGHSQLQDDATDDELPDDRDVSREKLSGFW